MSRVQSHHLQFPRLSTAWQPGLPAGIRQADCEGGADELAEADGDRLWNACDAYQQESLSNRFIHFNSEQLRDALLDTQDALGPATPSPEAAPLASFGRAIRTMWTTYRDRSLQEMARRGDLSSI
jgi:hypothetical protein